MSKVILLRCHQQLQFRSHSCMRKCQKRRRNDVENEEDKICFTSNEKKTSLHSLTRPMKPSINMCMHKIWWTNMKRRGWWSLCTIKNRRRINLAATVCRRTVKRARLYKHTTHAALCVSQKKRMYSTCYMNACGEHSNGTAHSVSDVDAPRL